MTTVLRADHSRSGHAAHRPLPAARNRPRWRALAGAGALLLAGLARAATLTVGPDGQHARLADALKQARDGDTVLVASGTYRGDVAVIGLKRLTIRGTGDTPPVLLADGRDAEGKAIRVVRDGEVLIEGLEFRGARVADRNGAGIRFENGHLTVRRCRFIDNENGILTSNQAAARLTVEDSLFAQAPGRPGHLDHLLYVGRIAEVSIRGSRFQQGHTGHLIKSRARVTRLSYNLIDDGPQGQASYEVDLPQGGLAVLVGNLIGQSARTQNPVMVAYGAEGPAWPDSRLVMAHNTLVNGLPAGGWFLRVWADRLPPGTPVHLVNNLLVGPGQLALANPAEQRGNQPAPPAALIDAAAPAFGLRPDSPLRGQAAPAGVLRWPGGEAALQPDAEFTLPIGTRPLPPRTRWSPGALQD